MWSKSCTNASWCTTKRHVAGIAMVFILTRTHLYLNRYTWRRRPLRRYGPQSCWYNRRYRLRKQMDIKVTGITQAMLKEALEKAKAGRHTILSEMNNSIDKVNTYRIMHLA